MKSGFLQTVATITCVAALLLAGGCKKKDDNATLPIAGSWMDVAQPNKAYLVFNNDATYIKLSSTAIGTHARSSDVYAADDNTLTFSPGTGSPQLYSYKVSNDSLYVFNVNEYLVYTKATVQAETWVKKPAVLQTIQVGTGLWYGALDWSGLDFVVSNPQAHKVYKIDGTTFNVYDSITVLQTAPGLAMLSTDTWLCNPGGDKKLHHVNSVTGATIFSSSAAVQAPAILATQGSDIWFVNTLGDMYIYNTLTDNFTLQHSDLGIQGNGSSFRPDMVIKDGYAYICLFTTAIKLNLTTYMVEETYELDVTQGYAIGIAHNGTGFYTLNVSVAAIVAGQGAVTLNKIEL